MRKGTKKESPSSFYWNIRFVYTSWCILMSNCGSCLMKHNHNTMIVFINILLIHRAKSVLCFFFYECISMRDKRHRDRSTRRKITNSKIPIELCVWGKKTTKRSEKKNKSTARLLYSLKLIRMRMKELNTVSSLIFRNSPSFRWVLLTKATLNSNSEWKMYGRNCKISRQMR